ncbi:hypothetical protein ACFFX0_24415 [Citricoccus parietis]|uniref:Uncharacterized protein n=1 Tax=Citricoccus parietis TaxID=592307 RepID=A0ABV5G5D2_9MICC
MGGRRLVRPLQDAVHAHVLLGMGHPLLDGAEGTAGEEVGGVHRRPGVGETPGQPADAVGQSQGVVEQQDLSHGEDYSPAAVRAVPLAVAVVPRRANRASTPAVMRSRPMEYSASTSARWRLARQRQAR